MKSKWEYNSVGKKHFLFISVKCVCVEEILGVMELRIFLDVSLF